MGIGNSTNKEITQMCKESIKTNLKSTRMCRIEHQPSTNGRSTHQYAV